MSTRRESFANIKNPWTYQKLNNGYKVKKFTVNFITGD